MQQHRNSNRVMEAGNHFKNGASPKSQMSRGNFLIGVTLLLALCGFTNQAMGQTWDISNQPSYGFNVMATLNGSTLTINATNGTGIMADFYDTQGKAMFGWDLDYRPPWYNYRTSIRTVVIGDGVGNIGDGAFEGCSNLTSVTIPISVTTIGVTSFMDCINLDGITIPACIGSSAGYYDINGQLAIRGKIEGGAFYGCSNLTVDCKAYSPSIYVDNNSPYVHGNEYPFNGIKKLRVLPWSFNDYPSNGYLKEIFYDEVLATPSYEEKTTTGAPILNTPYGCNDYKVYKVSIEEGVNYTFNPIGNNCISGIPNALYNSFGTELSNDLAVGSHTNYQSTFTGDAYFVVWGGYCSSFTLCYRGYLTVPTEVRAVQNGSSVNISWDGVPATTSYTVYRSNSYNGTYTAIKTEILSTNTIDNSPLSGANYYKVEAHNSFTKSDLSDCALGTAINEIEKTNIKVYPNPIQNELYIKSELPIKKVEIYSLTGSLLLFENNFSGNISISTLRQGVYMLKIYTDKGLFVSEIVKE